jgi:hypothetical protein
MPDYVQELHQGANTLLAHFHYGIKGTYPFSFKRNFPASMGELNEEQKAFIIDSAEYFEARSESNLPSTLFNSFTKIVSPILRGTVTQRQGRGQFS